MGISSGSQKSDSKSTTTTTPQAPTWISEPWQNYATQAKGFLDTAPSPASTGATDLQKQAYAGAGSLGLLKDVNLDPYMNPYTQSVIDTSTADLDRARRMAIVGNSAASATAGNNAWLGDRAGVADAETNRGFLDQVASLTAQLRSQAFTNAQAAAQGDIENARANATLQSDLGDKERAIAQENDPYNVYLKRLADYAALLNQIPASIFTGQVTDSSSKGSGTSFGAGLQF